jgi:hypothetical protein
MNKKRCSSVVSGGMGSAPLAPPPCGLTPEMELVGQRKIM